MNRRWNVWFADLKSFKSGSGYIGDDSSVTVETGRHEGCMYRKDTQWHILKSCPHLASDFGTHLFMFLESEVNYLCHIYTIYVTYSSSEPPYLHHPNILQTKVNDTGTLILNFQLHTPLFVCNNYRADKPTFIRFYSDRFTKLWDM
jgi:hypothetical protein